MSSTLESAFFINSINAPNWSRYFGLSPLISLPICQYLTPYGAGCPLATRFDPQAVWGPPLQYSTRSAALWGPSEKLTQITGSTPVNSQSWQNSSMPTSLGSMRPQTLLRDGARKSRSPIPFFQRYSPGSQTDPPQRRMPGWSSLIASTTSRRQP